MEIEVNNEIIDEVPPEELHDETASEEVIEESDDSQESNPETIRDEDEDEESRIVTIGEPEESEEPAEPEEGPNLVKTLRGYSRKLEKEKKQLARELRELKESTTVKEEPVELGPEPTLKEAGYDETKYRQSILEYNERKRKVEEREAQQKQEAEEQQKLWASKQEAYNQKKAEHSFKDYDDAEETVVSALSPAQTGIIVQGSKDPALLVYALGKNPGKLEELAKIKNHVDFIWALADVERQLKVSNRKAPKPEKRVSGGKAGGLSGDLEKQLDAALKESEKTNDLTKVMEIQRKIKLRDKG